MVMQMELIPYTESRRDEVELELANKRELAERHSQGIQVIAYWLVKQNVCTIWVSDERTNVAAEFEVPNEEVMSWFNHPYAHPNAPPDPRKYRGDN